MIQSLIINDTKSHLILSVKKISVFNSLGVFVLTFPAILSMKTKKGLDTEVPSPTL